MQQSIKSRKICLHILETPPIHASDYYKNKFAPQNINTNNTYDIILVVQKKSDVLIMYLGSVSVQMTSPYACYT